MTTTSTKKDELFHDDMLISINHMKMSDNRYSSDVHSNTRQCKNSQRVTLGQTKSIWLSDQFHSCGERYWSITLDCRLR